MNVSLFQIENVCNNLVAFQVAFDLFFWGGGGSLSMVSICINNQCVLFSVKVARLINYKETAGLLPNNLAI